MRFALLYFFWNKGRLSYESWKRSMDRRNKFDQYNYTFTCWKATYTELFLKIESERNFPEFPLEISKFSTRTNKCLTAQLVSVLLLKQYKRFEKSTK